MTVATQGTSGTAANAVASAAGRRLLDELAALLLPVVMPVVRRLPALILVFAAVISLMGVLALVAAHRDDAKIEAHGAVAMAQVLPGSDFDRTLVTFNTATGETVTPERGVFYPRGLRPGQMVRVEYDSTDPERVRVLGRDASVGNLPISLLIALTWAVALPIAFPLRGRQLRQIEATQQALAEATAVREAVAAEAAAARQSGSRQSGPRPGSRPPGSRQSGSPPPDSGGPDTGGPEAGQPGPGQREPSAGPGGNRPAR